MTEGGGEVEGAGLADEDIGSSTGSPWGSGGVGRESGRWIASSGSWKLG